MNMLMELVHSTLETDSKKAIELLDLCVQKLLYCTVLINSVMEQAIFKASILVPISVTTFKRLPPLTTMKE